MPTIFIVPIRPTAPAAVDLGEAVLDGVRDQVRADQAIRGIAADEEAAGEQPEVAVRAASRSGVVADGLRSIGGLSRRGTPSPPNGGLTDVFRPVAHEQEHRQEQQHDGTASTGDRARQPAARIDRHARVGMKMSWPADEAAANSAEDEPAVGPEPAVATVAPRTLATAPVPTPMTRPQNR